MKLTVNINDELINKCTETKVYSELVDTAKSTHPEINLRRGCRGFTTKALEFILNYTKPVGNAQDVVASGDTITYVTLKNVKETAHFFDTFKRLGINIGTLVVGVSGNSKTIYVSEKLVKDLNRHAGTDTLSAIVMYIMTLAKFCAKLFHRSEKFMVDTYSRKVILDDDFSDYVLGFDNTEYTVDIRGIQSEDFYSICWSFGAYHGFEYTLAPNAVEFNYNTVTNEKGHTYVMLEYSVGVNSLFYQITEDGMAITNADLSYFELQTDSLTRALLPRITTGAATVHKAFEGKEFTLIDTDEAPDWTRAYLADLSLRAVINEGIAKSKFKDLGMDVKGSVGVVDAETVRAEYADDEYAQQLYSQVQPYYDTFELGNLSNLLFGFAKGDVYAMMFTGESGTGKSTSARVIPYKCGIPYISVNFSVNIEESDLFGTMIPNPTKKDASGPEFIWQDGIITKAIRNGYCAILEEINFARPGVLGKLNSLLDENRQIDLPTGEIVKAHKNFRMIATCNIAYEGTNRLNKAFINRFEQVVNFENPTTDLLIEIIKSRTGYAKNDNIVKILDVYTALRKFSEEQNLDLVVSVRQLLNIFKQGKYYKTAKDAVENIMINGAFIEAPEYLNLFKKSILTAFDLRFKI